MSSWNGSGVFLISGTGLPYVGATVISSTVANQLNTDLATGLTNTICKDGQSTPTADIGFGGFKAINLAAGSSANDAVTFTQVSPATGTFTPIDSSGAGLSLTTPVGFYRKYAGVVHVWGSWLHPATGSTAAVLIGGLPFTAANLSIQAGGYQGIIEFNAGGGAPGSRTFYTTQIQKNTTTFIIAYAGGTGLQNTELAGFNTNFQFTYPI